MVELSINVKVWKGISKTATLDFWRADFELFRTLVGRVSWDSVLKVKGVQEGCSLLKKEQATPCATRRAGREEDKFSG